MEKSYSELKSALSAEWSKPKEKNAKKGQEARNYKEIKRLQIQINEHKEKMNK